MRIGVDANGLSNPRLTGVGRVARNLARGLLALAEEEDLELHLFSALPLNPDIRDEFADRERAHLYESRCPSRYLWQQIAFASVSRSRRLDAWLSFDGLLPIGLSIPSVVFVQDLIWYHHPETASRHIRAVYRLRARPSMRRARFLLPTCEYTKRLIVDFAPKVEPKLRVVPLAVEDWFRPVESDKKHEVLERLGIRPPYLLFVGNQMPHKNLRFLLRAFSRLKGGPGADGDPSPRLVLAGCPLTAGDSLERTVRELGIEHSVVTPGYLGDSDLLAVYSGARAFVFPSLMEGFGLPILEAQACGTPVLCANASSFPEVAGEGALFFDPRDEADLETALRRILQQNELRSSLVEKGFANRLRFSWPATTRAALNLLREAATTVPNASRQGTA